MQRISALESALNTTLPKRLFLQGSFPVNCKSNIKTTYKIIKSKSHNIINLVKLRAVNIAGPRLY